MKRLTILLPILPLLLAGCHSSSAPANPLDVALAPSLAAGKITPVDAPTAEVCHRLAADLLGHYLSASDAASQCSGSLSQIVDRMQASPDYLRVSERNWRDRFGSSDVLIDWRYLQDLYAQVDAMHAGTLGYREFAEIAMSHPGAIETVVALEPEDKVAAVYKAFIGRSPTATETAQLAALYRPWLAGSEADPAVPYIQRTTATILPELCGEIAQCSTTIFGGGSLDLSSFGSPSVPLLYDNLTDTQLEALREPGRLITSQDFFWEAGADMILNRYLSWSDGGRFPRLPGTLLPQVREALADYLKTTDSFPAAEKLLLTSQLYRMEAQVPDDGLGDSPTAPVPLVYAHGPVKAGDAEVFLDSIAPLTISLGACDQRYADGFVYFQIQQAMQEGMVSTAQGQADMHNVWTLREDQTPWDTQTQSPDFTYMYVARLIGGCPGYESQRQPATGLAYAFSQESLAELLCSSSYAKNLAPPGVANPTMPQVLSYQMQTVLGRSPTAADTSDYQAAFSTCSGTACSGAGLENAVCVGLLGSAEMVFY